MPELILTARDKLSKAYAGYDVDTNNYARFLERLVHVTSQLHDKSTRDIIARYIIVSTS